MSGIRVGIFLVFVSSSDEETSAAKSDEPIVKLCRVQSSQDSDHRNQNMPEEDLEKSPEPVPAINVTIDLSDSESDKETGEPVETGDVSVSVYNIEDSGASDTNSYTEVCQANVLPPSSSDSNHSVGDNEEKVDVILDSSDDEVEMEMQGIVTPPQPQPPPPPSDEAMALVLSAASQGGGGVDDGEGEPLFVIGRSRSSSSHAIRANSDSDEDVRILPSSSRSMKDSKDVIEID